MPEHQSRWRPERFVLFVSEDDGQVYLWLLRDLKADEQVFVDYGPEDATDDNCYNYAAKGFHRYGFLESEQDPLKILNVDDKAGAKRAFFTLSKKYHPDKSVHAPRPDWVFQRIRWAYDVLMGNVDPNSDYDSAAEDNSVQPFEQMFSGWRESDFSEEEKRGTVLEEGDYDPETDSDAGSSSSSSMGFTDSEEEQRISDAADQEIIGQPVEGDPADDEAELLALLDDLANAPNAGEVASDIAAANMAQVHQEVADAESAAELQSQYAGAQPNFGSTTMTTGRRCRR